MEVVINSCYGGFSLSRKAMIRYGALKGTPIYSYRCGWGDNKFIRSDDDSLFDYAYFTKPDIPTWEADEDSYISERDISRDDPALVQLVKELGKEANGMCASLKVVKIPDGIAWEISEYDGLESIEEKHNSWS